MGKDADDKKRNDVTDPPEGTLAWRQKQYDDAKKAGDGWDERTLWDIAQTLGAEGIESDWTD
jgi:hypothetical protein